MRIPIEEINHNPALLDDITAALKAGGLIVYPTDTVYGFGCDAFNATAVERLRQIKKSDADKPMSIICGDLLDIHKYANLPGYAFTIIKERLPGPFTFLLPIKHPQLKILLPFQTKVGIRIPNHPIPLEIVKRLKSPLVSTSVNRAGHPTIAFPNIIEEQFGAELAYLIDDGVLLSDPSSVVDLTEDVPRVLREGKGSVSHFL